MSEKDYQEYIEGMIRNTYESYQIEQSVYLTQTRRYVDFLIDVGFVTLAVEVEHSSDSVVEEGLSQALLYAAHRRDWLPVIIYPPDGENEAELQLIGQKVGLIPVEHKHR